MIREVDICFGGCACAFDGGYRLAVGKDMLGDFRGRISIGKFVVVCVVYRGNSIGKAVIIPGRKGNHFFIGGIAGSRRGGDGFGNSQKPLAAGIILVIGIRGAGAAGWIDLINFFAL